MDITGQMQLDDQKMHCHIVRSVTGKHYSKDVHPIKFPIKAW